MSILAIDLTVTSKNSQSFEGLRKTFKIKIDKK